MEEGNGDAVESTGLSVECTQEEIDGWCNYYESSEVSRLLHIHQKHIHDRRDLQYRYVR
jgi:hypothetical protein